MQTFANLAVFPQRGAALAIFSPASDCCLVGNPCGLQCTDILVAKLSHTKKLLFREFFAATIGTKNSITNPNPWGFSVSEMSKNNNVSMGCDVVTGGAGFIGSHLVDRLIASKRRVRVLDNFVVGRRSNLQQHDGDPLLEIVENDITDSAAVTAACAGAERIFHLAARADIVPSIQQPEAYFRANVDGTFVMLETARRLDVQRFIYVASSSCYGITNIYPTPESAPADPRYPYALTKYLGEQLVLHWAQVYRLPAVSVRLFNVYGPRARTSWHLRSGIWCFLGPAIGRQALDHRGRWKANA